MPRRTTAEDTLVKKEIEAKKKKQKEIKNKFLTIIHTGDGKGKTTAALGMLMRMVAHGWKAAMVQFMKDPNTFKYAEHKLEKKFKDLDIFMAGAGFTWDTRNRDLDIQTTIETWNKAKEIMLSGKYQMVVLDEINYAIDYELLEEKKVVKFLRTRPMNFHLVLTGRNASQKLIQLADLVTEMKNIKHPYEKKGILAQKGIEW